MSRINPVSMESAPAAAKPLLEAVQKKLGVTPNMMKTMAHAPGVLEAYLNFSGALAKGTLDGKTREAIALRVAQSNECGYCLSAHSLLGQKSGLSTDDVSAARHGKASNAKLGAILVLADAINTKQGHITDADFAAAKSAGVNDAEIAEVIGNVSLNVFTNYFNHVTDPEIDFPRVAL